VGYGVVGSGRLTRPTLGCAYQTPDCSPAPAVRTWGRRLATEVAAVLADGFADGAHFVDLASVRNSALVQVTVAHLRRVGDAVPDRGLGGLTPANGAVQAIRRNCSGRSDGSAKVMGCYSVVSAMARRQGSAILAVGRVKPEQSTVMHRAGQLSQVAPGRCGVDPTGTRIAPLDKNSDRYYELLFGAARVGQAGRDSNAR
jgi:hypothetical protein